MPVYVYMCLKCEHLTELVRPVARREDGALCERCGAAAAYVPAAPGMVLVSRGTYHDISLRNPTGKVT